MSWNKNAAGYKALMEKPELTDFKQYLPAEIKSVDVYRDGAVCSEKHWRCGNSIIAAADS